MARTKTARLVQLAPIVPGPGAQVDIKPLLFPVRGMNYALRPNQIPLDMAVDVQNLMVRYGRYTTRPGTAAVGSAASGTLTDTYEFVKSDGTRYYVRFLTTKVQYWDGLAWTDISGITLTGDATNHVSVTTHSDKLIFCNGKDGIFQITLPAGTGSLVAAAPVAKHVTTWLGRVIASCIAGNLNRVQWSVKNSYTDWSGLGSGSEDLLSTPGGVVDEVMGVFPVTENVAYCLRSGSVWQMAETGIFDTPFVFSRLWAGAGSISRFGVASVPGGIIYNGKDEIYELMLGSVPKPVGTVIKDALPQAEGDMREAYAAYDPKFDEFFLFIPGAATDKIVYRYHRPTASWTADKYPFDIVALSYGRYTTDTPVDLLSGVVDDLTGTADALGQSVSLPGLILTTSTYVIMSDQNSSNLASRDADGAGSRTSSGWYIITGQINADQFLQKTELVEVQIVYETLLDCTLVLEYSDDGGNTWNSYSSKSLTTTTSTQIASFVKTLERKNIMLRFSVSTAGVFRLMAVYARVVTGAMVIP